MELTNGKPLQHLSVCVGIWPVASLVSSLWAAPSSPFPRRRRLRRGARRRAALRLADDGDDQLLGANRRLATRLTSSIVTASICALRLST